MADTTRTTIYQWTDREERAYAVLRHGGGHWRLEWGYRDPPGSDNTVQRGEHVTSDREEAVRWMLQQVRRLATEPDEAPRVERELRAALEELEPSAEQE
jgi:hypothetical protein